MKKIILQSAMCLLLFNVHAQQPARTKVSFNKEWKFYLGDRINADKENFNDSKWRNLNLPHDWSIEGKFEEKSRAGYKGGSLTGGIGWYRKTFMLPAIQQGKHFFIDFDGVYKNSEVWINGHYLGLRPNGYISFEYDITPYLKFGSNKNIIAVKVDNSKQPNSRWYSGSGIYRNVWLVSTGDIIVDHWGSFITTLQVSAKSATVNIKSTINNLSGSNHVVNVTTILYDQSGKEIAKKTTDNISVDSTKETAQEIIIENPTLWNDVAPVLYTAKTFVINNGKVADEYETTFGIRSFYFDMDSGFILNGKHVKIRGVCMHHDLGCLGSALNYRALQRQLMLLKDMGCNGIRTSHNPPAPELLELCDKMGFIVMDEAFDCWKKGKNPFDYSLDWDQWHVRDLRDQLLRDRNHPSVFIWSVGNEIREQWAEKGDTSGKDIIRELVAIVKSLDTTRETVTANDEVNKGNNLLQANAASMIGYNYHQKGWAGVEARWGRKPFIVTESVSALQTRGHYDMPSDTVRRWPLAWNAPFTTGNADLTASAYDNCSTPWGSTHEETLKVFEKLQQVSGMFIWTGFDYIGEPTPYRFPARSSYFGIIDLAGFPKDVYYMYQSVWTNKPVLHILPHWNWKNESTVDVWVYYNNADEVELFLNGKSLGTKKKSGDDLHVQWSVQYEAGVIKAVSKKDGKEILSEEIKTAGSPAKIVLSADRNTIDADGSDLSFITAKIVDAAGTVVPGADNIINFTTQGNIFIDGTDNGSQTDLQPFKSSERKAFNGLCLAVIKPGEKTGTAIVTASAKGLPSASVTLQLK